MKIDTSGLISEYRKRRNDIKLRLEEFRRFHRATDHDIFPELCFCITTANANAMHCDKAIKELKDTGLLWKGSAEQIRPKLKGRVRFHNKKADYIVAARGILKRSGCIDIKSRIDPDDIVKTRDWIVANIKGIGYKEASHFLRNIGLGQNIAILDRHILKNLKKYDVIEKIPVSVGSRKVYLDIEEKMKGFSKKVKIPMDEMDLLFWSIQTGFIFK